MRMLDFYTPDLSWSRRHLSPSFIMGDVFDDFDRIVNSFLQPTYATTVNFQPSCDIKKTDDHYLVSFDMPGVKKEDIKIEVRDNQLVISGERHLGGKEKSNEATLRQERSHGKFERIFSLPSTVDCQKIEACYENGVLNIAIPKDESAKTRTIQVQSGSNSFISKLLGSKKEEAKELKDVKVS